MSRFARHISEERKGQGLVRSIATHSRQFDVLHTDSMTSALTGNPHIQYAWALQCCLVSNIVKADEEVGESIMEIS